MSNSGLSTDMKSKHVKTLHDRVLQGSKAETLERLVSGLTRIRTRIRKGGSWIWGYL